MARVAGTVVATSATHARVACASVVAGCGTCAQGQGCGASPQRPARTLDVPLLLDGRPLEPGERIELDADEGALLRAATRLYLPPLAGLIALPAMVRLLGLEQGAVPFLAALAGLALGGLAARLWTRANPVIGLRRLAP